MQDAGCPLERHELTDHEWIALGAIKREREWLNAPKPEDYGWREAKQ